MTLVNTTGSYSHNFASTPVWSDDDWLKKFSGKTAEEAEGEAAAVETTKTAAQEVTKLFLKHPSLFELREEGSAYSPKEGINHQHGKMKSAHSADCSLSLYLRVCTCWHQKSCVAASVKVLTYGSLTITVFGVFLQGEPPAKKGRVNPQVYMDIKIGNKPAGRMRFLLRADIVPMTAGCGPCACLARLKKKKNSHICSRSRYVPVCSENVNIRGSLSLPNSVLRAGALPLSF